MNTNEIKEEIKKTRKQLEELEAKLEASKKWEPKEYNWVPDIFVFNKKINSIYTAETSELATHLATYIENLATLQSLANELNDGWIYDPYNPHQPTDSRFELVYHTDKRAWVIVSAMPHYYRNVPYFKSKTIAKQACDILNSQRGLIQI